MTREEILIVLANLMLVLDEDIVVERVKQVAEKMIQELNEKYWNDHSEFSQSLKPVFYIVSLPSLKSQSGHKIA